LPEKEEKLSADLMKGLEITVMGMGLVFVTIGILILTMIILMRLSKGKNKEEPGAAESIEEAPEAGSATTAAAEDEEIAAVIAVALASFKTLDRSQSSLGKLLLEPETPWAISGRQVQVSQWER
jgi:sodium pump decarboxylase gamma subunit